LTNPPLAGMTYTIAGASLGSRLTEPRTLANKITAQSQGTNKRVCPTSITMSPWRMRVAAPREETVHLECSAGNAALRAVTY